MAQKAAHRAERSSKGGLMKVPALGKYEREAWQVFDQLSEDELYAIVGSPPVLGVPLRAEENLVLGTWIKVTRESVKRGRAEIAKVTRDVKGRLCPAWREFDKQHRRKITRAEIFALILECVVASLGLHVFPPPIATATLICKTCEYSLERLCVEV